MKKVKPLTQLFQVVDTRSDRIVVRRTFRTAEARQQWLSSEELAKNLAGIMSDTTFTTREIWTNMKEDSIKELCKE